MRSALRSANNNIERVPNGGSSSLSRKALDQNNYKSLKDPEISALIWRTSDQGYIILTFVTIEPDQWKFLAPLLPLQGSDHRNQSGSGGNVSMDRLLVVSPTPPVSVPVDQQRAQRSQSTDRAYSAKSFLANKLFQSSPVEQSRSRRLLNRRAKVSKSPESSQHNSSLSSNSSVLIDDGSKTSCSADLVKDKRKADKPVKRSSKKKAKKRGKQGKRPVCYADPTGVETFCQESICQSSLSETCANIELAWDDRSISCDNSVENAMPHEVSLHDVCMDRSDSERNNNCIINHSEISATATSYSSVPVPQSFVSKDIGIDSANEIQMISKVLPTLDREVTDNDQKNTSYCNDISSEVISDISNGTMLDLTSDGWTSDASASASASEEKSTIKENNGIDFSGSSNNDNSLDGLGKGLLFPENYSNVVNADDQTERTKCGSQGCSSSEFHLVLYGKRGRQGRKLFGSSAGINKFNNGANVHGRSGKENNNSVWQKVQRNDIDGCDFQSNNAPPVSSRINSDAILNSQANNKSKVNFAEKMKRKPDAESKQEPSCYSRKRPPACKTNSSGGTRINIQQKEASQIPSEVNHHKGILAGSRSHCPIEPPGGGFDQSCRVDLSLSESIQDSKVCLYDTKPIESVSKGFNMDGANKNSPSSGAEKTLDQKQLLEVHSDGNVYLPINSVPARLQAEISHTENGKQDHHSGSVLQKWIPVVRKDAEMTAANGSGNLLTSHLDESAANESKIKDEEELSLSAQSSVPLVESMVSSGDISCPAPNDECQNEKLRFDNSCATEKPSDINAIPNCILAHEPKYGNSCMSETIPNKTTQAIKDAYRMQLASEGLHLATGRPLAEFERLIYSASPVLGQAHSIGKCESCSRNQFTGASMCLNEIPNLSLGSLWQWYEKHGSYGLEVKAEDYQNSKTMGAILSEFRAYFVPFLSAVQLFGNCRGGAMNTCKEIPRGGMLKAHETNTALENSFDASHLPITSVLTPKPCIENRTSQPESLSSSELSSASGQEGESSPSFRATCFDDLQLIFEFFESAQPQHRPPLFEKIKELVRGEGISNCQAYGDPSKLESLHLHDLHPASWYSVAWYPIYRIPDGHFRAAFLTFHSLGHLINRSTLSDCFDGDSSIVSPVVGLQSYNSQSECWFQPRQNVVTLAKETSIFNHSEFLKERLRTLEETANVMARGVVRKGNVQSTNRQPDYEFFLSRRRW